MIDLPDASRSRHILTPRVTITVTVWAQKEGRRHCRLPRVPLAVNSPQGTLTVVPSPLLLIVNVPAALLDAYAYAAQPDGAAGTDAMNGPAT